MTSRFPSNVSYARLRTGSAEELEAAMVSEYSAAARNVYQGRRVAPNVIQFTFAWDDPGDLTSRIIRLTNLRTNASRLSVQGAAGLRMRVRWDGPEIRGSNGLVVGLAQESMDLENPSMSLLPGGAAVRRSLGSLRR